MLCTQMPMHDVVTPGNTMMPVVFCFADDKTFNGFADGSTWNGFDNIWVTPEELEKIKSYFIDEVRYDREELGMDDLPIDEDGLVSLANGFATQIDEE